MSIIYKKITFISIAFIFSFLFLQEVSADGKTYKVTSDSLEVKGEATENANVIGHLQKNDQLQVFKEEHGWAQTYYDGDIAWVAAHYLVEENSPKNNKTSSTESKKKNTNTAKQVTMAEDIVNIRKSPSTDDTIVYIAKKGDKFDHVKTEGDWHQIKLNDGSKAWVASWVTTNDTSTKKKKRKNSQTSNKTSTPNVSLDGKNIMLDPGHGGSDPGAIAADGSYEKDLTLQLTKKIANNLEQSGATVTMVRTDDQTIPLHERIAFNKLFITDAYISIHFNAFTDKNSSGISTHYYNGQKEEALANAIQNELVDHTDLNDRGVQQDNYHVLRENNDRSILLELGFISNPDELEQIQSEEYANNVSNALIEGLYKHFY